uniref:Uncharacterized protein n=1 Tax=Gruberia lanceolata TaxID=1978530 RepID=A0A6C0UCL4_9CILI|nr:hypothetical protein [Gruberia lanceolata]
MFTTALVDLLDFFNIFFYKLIYWTMVLYLMCYYYQRLSIYTLRQIIRIPKTNNIFWWDAWSYYTPGCDFSYLKDTPWEMYYKYKLSIWSNWHILEERICLFLIYFYFFLL